MMQTALVEQAFLFEGNEVRVELDLECMDLSLPFAAIEEELTDRSSNDLAAYMAADIRHGMRPMVEAAVYVIGKMYTTGCKVGSSSNPELRTRDMQVNGAPDLYLAALLWTLGETPFSLERMAINEAGSRGRRVHGEWLSLTPGEAAKMIYRRAQERGDLIATSQMHCRNMKLIDRAEHQAHYEYIREEWGTQRAAYWLSQNRLAA